MLDHLPIRLFLNEATSYPYTISFQALGLYIINNTGTAFTVTITNSDGSLVIPVPADGTFSGEFNAFKTITQSGGTDFDIAIRGHSA